MHKQISDWTYAHFLMQSLVNGMGISIVTERFLSLRKEICLRDHSTFLE